MKPSDEELMAHADGELEPERRLALDAALAADAALRARVEALRAQRQRVAAAYHGTLDEPVPQRLRALLDAPPPAVVVDLATMHARKTPWRSADTRSNWMQWGGMAASVLLGVLLGLLFAPRGDVDALLAERAGRLVAGDALSQALSAQLAGDERSAPAVAVPLSFVDKAGRYCRTFSSAHTAGLACRNAGQWEVLIATPAQGDAAAPMRQAASSLPRAVLDAVDQRIEGNALNAAQERDARARDWKR
jgi:anti-sigma factor RsiW